MSARLKDVAQAVGLSPALVSRVLNERPGVWASAETRRRVHEAAEALGYRPNDAARSLRRGKTSTVALVVPSRDELPLALLAHVAAELAAFLYTRKYHLLIQPLPTQKQTLDHLAQLARARTCDLVVLWGVESQVAAQGELLAELGMPFVVKGRFEREYPDWPQADFDHEGMMHTIVRGLYEQGCRRIAYIGHVADHPFRHRLIEGLHEALALAPGMELVDEGLLEAAYFPREALAAVDRWWSRPEGERPDAVLMGADSDAWDGLERGLARYGLRLGEGPGEVRGAGLCASPLRLLFGQARVFDTGFSGLASALCRDLIDPILEDRRPLTPIVRYLPTLHAADSLALLDIGLVRFPER